MLRFHSLLFLAIYITALITFAIFYTIQIIYSYIQLQTVFSYMFQCIPNYFKLYVFYF